MTATDTNQHILIGFLAETFIHSGVGQSQSAIDLPVARESATAYPFVPGSSLKGALRDYSRRIDGWEDVETDDGKTEMSNPVKEMFGQQEGAGKLLVSDLRLLLLPVRSLTSNYRLVTCPQILIRLQRDLSRAQETSSFEFQETHVSNEVKNEEYKKPGGTKLFLEELSFIEHKDTNEQSNESLIKLLKVLCPELHDIEKKLVIIDDDSFSWFAKYALSTQARNELDDNKTSKGLWFEESLPPDTLMYGVLSNRIINSTTVKDIADKIKKNKYIQTGGNETIGMGWFQMSIYSSSNSGTNNHE